MSVFLSFYSLSPPPKVTLSVALTPSQSEAGDASNKYVFNGSRNAKQVSEVLEVSVVEDLKLLI